MTSETSKRARIRPADAADLTEYYQSSESACGFRSSHGSIVDLIANSAHLDSLGRANGTEAAMVKRLDHSMVHRHRKVRAALLTIERPLQDTLFLTYGLAPSKIPAPVRRNFGLIAGAALLTPTFHDHYVPPVNQQPTVAAAFAVLERLCSGSASAVIVALQAEAEAVLAEAHTAYAAARDQQDPERLAKRSVPGRAAGGYARADRIVALIRAEAEAEAAEETTLQAEARKRLLGLT